MSAVVIAKTRMTRIPRACGRCRFYLTAAAQIALENGPRCAAMSAYAPFGKKIDVTPSRDKPAWCPLALMRRDMQVWPRMRQPGRES